MNMREEFEKWLSNCLGPFVDMSRDVDDGVYEWQDVRLAWLAWKAAQPEWIKCSERMPPVNTWVIVVTDIGYCYTAYFNDHIKSWDDGNFYSDIKGVIGWRYVSLPFGINPPTPPEE
ncbi:DUF551 domain-containing protein [Edwardsiella piscicida]|uniref:DUF551 domain-containing protein n=1 Tax=Edwardsiella piscicida TaxID=1263550 RepID=UPI000D51B3F9|nr:DUF551 domain-containing protein [Edwardsiella piscicida]UCQ36412.1 DUF551 domain-containing protein [Edwardsiella piscicida]